MSLKKENLTELIEAMNKTLSNIPHIIRTNQDTFDLEVSAEEINPSLLHALEMLEPFGKGNEKPIFKMKGIKLDSFNLMKDIHVRWNFSSKRNPSLKLKGVSFNYINRWGHPHPKEIFQNSCQNDEDVTIYFTLGINRFKGSEHIQLMVNKITTEIF